MAAIRALTAVIKHSSASTLMGVSKDLEEAAAALQRSVPPISLLSLPDGPHRVWVLKLDPV